MTKLPCKPRVTGDTTVCVTCQLRWDTNDEPRPRCPSAVPPGPIWFRPDNLWRRFLRLCRINARRPIIEISRSGQATPIPHVHVSMCSRNGMQGMYTIRDDPAGNAQAEMYARSLNHITGLPVLDMRQGIHQAKRLERTT